MLQREQGMSDLFDPQCLREAIDKPDNALALLKAIYRNSEVALAVRMRAAIEALPFENPRLSAVAVGSVTGQDFARMLDAAILRSGKAQEVGQLVELKAIDVTPRPNEAEQVSAAHQQQSFPRPRRR